MADNKRSNLPKVDRRGSSILVPIGVIVGFIALSALLLMLNSPQGKPPPPLGETAKIPGPK